MTEAPQTTASRLVSEFVGTGFLLLSVVGSGIMAERLSPNDVGLQLLENSIATAGALTCLILLFGSTSGAHFNPAVTLWARVEGDLDNRMAGLYVLVQTAGGILGVIAANVIFELDAVFWSTKDRISAAAFLSEIIATFGLIIVIIGVVRSGKSQFVAFAVAAYIGCLHRRRLLLHVVDQLRQSCSDRGPHVLRHVRRHRPRERPAVHRGAVHRGTVRHRRGADHTPSALMIARQSGSGQRHRHRL